MKCEKARNHAALFVEGDLAEAGAKKLLDHVKRCVGCAAFLEGLKESQDALKSFRQEPLPSDELRVLRQEVLEHIAKTQRRSGVLQRQGGGILAGILPLAAAFIVALVALFQQPQHLSPESTVNDGKEMVRQAEVSEPSSMELLAESVAPVERAPKREPMVIKMFTSDPDIVIIWLSDSNEEMEHETHT